MSDAHDPSLAGTTRTMTDWRRRLAGNSALGGRWRPAATLHRVDPIALVEPPPILPTKRSRIWELESYLHCSVIGTCLSTQELRTLLQHLGVRGADAASDHELHGQGVTVAGRRDVAGKLLHKTLDRRHQATIARFDRASSPAQLRQLWQEHLDLGEIPGAYWAVLTHPLADPALTRLVFGEVHMLSHLVGAANRADISRLRRLEAENATLRATIERQQVSFRDAVVSRDAKIQALDRALDQAVAERPAAPEAAQDDTLVEALKREFDAESRRRTRAERALERAAQDRATAQAAQAVVEAQAAELRAELETIETALAGQLAPESVGDAAPIALDGRTILYVGGRAGAVAQARAWIARHGGVLLHHDGGIEDRDGLLGGLVNRADLVLFPVDCISHSAVATIKRLCHQVGKSYLPLRSAGLTSLLAALRQAAQPQAAE